MKTITHKKVSLPACTLAGSIDKALHLLTHLNAALRAGDYSRASDARAVLKTLTRNYKEDYLTVSFDLEASPLEKASFTCGIRTPVPSILRVQKRSLDTVREIPLRSISSLAQDIMQPCAWAQFFLSKGFDTSV